MLIKDINYCGVGREGVYKGETQKAHKRRLREGWFEKYASPLRSGIDIGCGIDPINDVFFKWDIIYGDGDATYMDGIPDNHFSTVYASHILEHLENPVEAVSNWWRILQPGGHLIVVVPHRDLYERRLYLPSKWNSDHKYFWLPVAALFPHTRSLVHTIVEATSRDEILVRVLDEGYSDGGEEGHPSGEYSIEAIVRK